MWIFTDIADWWDKKNQQSEAVLDQFVADSGYSQGTMIVAASAHAFTTFGAGFVDVLRLGDGVKKGNLAGIGTDALRFVAIFPVGKAAGMLKTANGFQAAKLVADVKGPICSWVATTKALAQIGQKSGGKLFATVEDLARAAGVPLNSIGAIRLTDMLLVLKKIGATTGPVKRITSFKAIKAMIPFDGSVVLVSLKVILKNGTEAGHAIYVYRDILGRIRIMDRTVGKVTQKAYVSLEEVVKEYERSGVRNLIPEAALILHNVYGRAIGFELPRLVMPILGVIAEKGAK